MKMWVKWKLNNVQVFHRITVNKDSYSHRDRLRVKSFVQHNGSNPQKGDKAEGGLSFQNSQKSEFQRSPIKTGRLEKECCYK